MINWLEQPADFGIKPLAALLAELPFTAAAALHQCPPGKLRVVIPQSVLSGIVDHLQQQNVEMGGLLIGRVFDGASDRTVKLDASVASEEFVGTGVSLTMGTAVWDKARGLQGPGQSVVGWYHSHPNLGVFFSGTDRRTQAAFFREDHAIGLVVDPIRHQRMWFSGAQSLEVESEQVLLV